jgi:hypothetical protein
VAKDAQRESWKMTRQPRDLTKNRQRDSLKQGQLTLSQKMRLKGDYEDDEARTKAKR